MEKEIIDDIHSRGLSDPSIRINAFESVEGLINYALKKLYERPQLLMKVDKDELKKKNCSSKEKQNPQ